mgnify:CR=1 FL=1
MANKLKNSRLIVVFYSSPDYITDKSKVGMSGGNRIFLESIKRWKDKVGRIEILTCEPGKLMLDTYLDDFDTISVNVMKIPRIFFQNLFVLFLYKTILGSYLAVKETIRSSKPIIIFSTSDIFPDSIPAFFARLLNKKIKWVAAFYFFASSPFSKEFPYTGLNAILRGSIYYLTQRGCYFLIRQFSDYVVACNELERKQFIADHYVGQNICTIYGGVDLKIPESVPEPEKKSYDAVFMARFHPQKGPMEAVKVWNEVVKKHQNAKLAMIGNGPEEDAVRAFIRNHHLEENISLKGFMDGIEKYKVLKSAWLFLHPAIYETGGMAAAEGMAAGLPVVAFDHEGYDHCYPRGIIRVSPIGDCLKMAENVIYLLSNASDYAKFQAEARSVAMEFCWDFRTSNLFDKITSGLKFH